MLFKDSGRYQTGYYWSYYMLPLLTLNIIQSCSPIADSAEDEVDEFVIWNDRKFLAFIPMFATTIILYFCFSCQRKLDYFVLTSFVLKPHLGIAANLQKKERQTIFQKCSCLCFSNSTHLEYNKRKKRGELEIKLKSLDSKKLTLTWRT